MSRFSENWKNQNKWEHVGAIVAIILSVIVIIVAGCGLFRIIDIALANRISIPLLGFVILINGFMKKKNNPKGAKASFFTAIFIFICTIAVYSSFFLR